MGESPKKNQSAVTRRQRAGARWAQIASVFDSGLKVNDSINVALSGQMGADDIDSQSDSPKSSFLPHPTRWLQSQEDRTKPWGSQCQRRGEVSSCLLALFSMTVSYQKSSLIWTFEVPLYLQLAQIYSMFY